MGGKSSPAVDLGRGSIESEFNVRLQFLAGMKSHDTASRNRNFLAGFGIASGTLGLVTQLKIAETGKLYAIACFKSIANLFEKSLNHVLGLTLVEANPLKQQVSEFRFGERHRHFLFHQARS